MYRVCFCFMCHPAFISFEKYWWVDENKHHFGPSWTPWVDLSTNFPNCEKILNKDSNNTGTPRTFLRKIELDLWLEPIRLSWIRSRFRELLRLHQTTAAGHTYVIIVWKPFFKVFSTKEKNISTSNKNVPNKMTLIFRTFKKSRKMVHIFGHFSQFLQSLLQ